MFAFFGAIRRSKGVENLVSCFQETRNPNLRLTITGVPYSDDIEHRLEQAARLDSRISLGLRIVSDFELQESVLAADAVVLPFEKILHSGSIIYALSCGKAVLTPNTPYAGDLQKQVGSQWLRTYAPPLTANDLSRLERRPQGKPNLEFLSIVESGRKLKHFYEQLCLTRSAHKAPLPAKTLVPARNRRR